MILHLLHLRRKIRYLRLRMHAKIPLIVQHVRPVLLHLHRLRQVRRVQQPAGRWQTTTDIGPILRLRVDSQLALRVFKAP